MAPPQVPAGGLVGQAVLDDQSHGQRNDRRGGMGFGQGVVGHVRIEVVAAPGTAVLRIPEMNVAWPSGDQVADVVQDPRDGSDSETPLPAGGTRALPEVAAALN